MAQPTLGAWRVEEVGAGELFIVQPDGEGGWWPIAEMSKDNAWDDARLIAAAPTLLEALRAALTAAEHLLALDPTGPRIDTQIRVAIRLAEGEK